MQPLTRIGKGHVERLGKDHYIAQVTVYKGGDRKDVHELDDIDPHRAETQAREFCERNNISLQIFTVAPEVIRAHLNDMNDWLNEETDRKVKPQYIRRSA